MKKYLFIFTLLLGVFCSYAQNTNVDFVVLDQSAPNLAQLQTQFSGQPNVFFNNNPKPAPYIIAAMLEGKQVVDMHIYVATEPGSINFNSVSITPATAANYSQYFLIWQNFINGKVVIHSSNVFTSTQGAELKALLIQLTGLDFITP